MQPASSSFEAQWPDLVAAVSAAIDLEAAARASGALVRRRAIRSAEMLLRAAGGVGPRGVAAAAACACALVRRRAIRSAEMLLRLALAYGPGGLSLRAAAAWAGASGLAELSGTAGMARVGEGAGGGVRCGRPRPGPGSAAWRTCPTRR